MNGATGKGHVLSMNIGIRTIVNSSLLISMIMSNGSRSDINIIMRTNIRTSINPYMHMNMKTSFSSGSITASIKY